MSSLTRHPFHLVDESPWPFLRSLRSFILVLGFLKIFYLTQIDLIIVGIILILFIIFQWWIDVASEALFQGLHTKIVELGIRWGIILFIISEIFFFISFFWAFFHNRLAPALEVGSSWPPQGILPLNAFDVPLINTIILISSGITVTRSHHYMLTKNWNKSISILRLTLILGVIFTILQGIEYHEASFSIADGIYGSTFYIATGFHGLHVIIGSIFLFICLLRLRGGHFSDSHHFGFEAAAWYWHFVDVVWLFLYISIYWWGSL